MNVFWAMMLASNHLLVCVLLVTTRACNRAEPVPHGTGKPHRLPGGASEGAPSDAVPTDSTRSHHDAAAHIEADLLSCSGTTGP